MEHNDGRSRICDTQENQDRLANLVHTEHSDFSATYHVNLQETKEGIASMAVTPTVLETWGITVEQLHQDALVSDMHRLRLLIPATTMDSSHVKKESFVAAFMLGMKEYFGNVDHLRATVSEVPVPDADYRKQYLVIYDSVPGGTGYLKQLMHEKNALIDIFEKALHVMENCTCKDDPQKDGCYHCLFAYRQSQQIGHISRAAAIRMLKAILSGKDNIEQIQKINDIPVNPLFDSELELRFMEAIRQKVGAANVSDTIRNGKHSYYVKINDHAWEIEPQVLLGPDEGVKVQCKLRTLYLMEI